MAASSPHGWASCLVSTPPAARLASAASPSGGDAYLRTLLMLGARAALQTAAQRSDRLSRWALAVRERRGYHRAIIAIAAKNARILWTLLAKDRDFVPVA